MNSTGRVNNINRVLEKIFQFQLPQSENRRYNLDLDSWKINIDTGVLYFEIPKWEKETRNLEMLEIIES